jgi:hypothetical protein
MTREPTGPTLWPTGELDRRVMTPLLDGGRAGAAAALVALVVFMAAETTALDHDSAAVAARALRFALIGLGLGPIFAWLTGRLPAGLVPVGLVAGVLYALGWGLFSPLPLLAATELVPALAWGGTLGLVLRHLRRRRPGSAPPPY